MSNDRISITYTNSGKKPPCLCNMKLQGKWWDIVCAVRDIDCVKISFEDVRKNIDACHSKWLQEATVLAGKVCSTLRVSARQTQCLAIRFNSE